MLDKKINNTISLNVVKWKLDAAISSLQDSKHKVPSTAIQFCNSIKAGKEIQEELLQAAYAACAPVGKRLHRVIDRLGYLRKELLILVDLYKDKQIDTNVVNSITDALMFIPSDPQSFSVCEVYLRKSLSLVMPEELKIADTALFSKALKVEKGTVSNQVFNIVRLGRTSTNEDDRRMILELIKNQNMLMNVLYNADGHTPLPEKAFNKVLRVVHWQPRDIPGALELYLESKEIINQLN